MGVGPRGDVAGCICQAHLNLRLRGGSLHSLVNRALPHADAGDLADLGAQSAELKGVKQAVDGRHIGRAACQVGGTDLQVHVGQQVVEASVAHDVVHVLAQGGAALAADLLGAGQEVIQAVELVDPLSGRLGANAGNARQVVGGLAHDGSDLRVAVRRHPVLGFHGLGRHPAQITGAGARVQDRHVVGHRLEGVAIPRHDQHGRALVAGAVGQRRQNVVSLKALA